MGPTFGAGMAADGVSLGRECGGYVPAQAAEGPWAPRSAQGRRRVAGPRVWVICTSSGEVGAKGLTFGEVVGAAAQKSRRP
ncbi:hypothetical protein MYIN104542_29430 [Mycobacterium intermedium]